MGFLFCGFVVFFIIIVSYFLLVHEIILWVVVKHGEDNVQLVGIFSTKEKAIKRCNGQKEYGVGPIILNHILSDEITEWKGYFFPNGQNTKNL